MGQSFSLVMHLLAKTKYTQKQMACKGCSSLTQQFREKNDTLLNEI